MGPESPSEQARRVFQSFDPEGNEHLCIIDNALSIIILAVSRLSHCLPLAHLFVLKNLLISHMGNLAHTLL